MEITQGSTCRERATDNHWLPREKNQFSSGIELFNVNTQL